MMVLVNQLLEPLEEFINIPVGIGALPLETNPSGGANVRNLASCPRKSGLRCDDPFAFRPKRRRASSRCL